jgi:hypothetical protein
MHELKLVKQKLKYKEALNEKQLTGTTAKVIGNFTDGLKDFAFDLAMNIVFKLFTRKEKKADN